MMGKTGVRRIVGVSVALLASVAIAACGGGGREPAGFDPGALVFTSAPSNKAVKLLVSARGEWKITSISIVGPDAIKFIKQDQCANHVFVVAAVTKECEEVVQFFGVFEAGLSATLVVTGAGINGSVGTMTLRIPLSS